MRRRQLLKFSSLVGSGIILSNCTNGTLQIEQTEVQDRGPLKIWWQEGFYPEETDVLQRLITEWEEQTDNEVQLEIIPQKDILNEVESALETDSLPDILYSGVADLTIIPRLAWNNQLADLTEVIEPLSDWYSDSVLNGVTYQNQVTGARSYYAVPIMQSAIHIHYWQSLLNKAALKREDIPEDWEGFWQFWQQTQDILRQNGEPTIYGVGMPMSLSLDTYNNFEQFLEAYNVKLLDENGNLLTNQAQTRQELARVIENYASFFKNEKVPPESIDWDNTGNNVTVLSRESLMTVNHTLSVPGSQRDDKAIYYDELSTVKWPNKPDGSPMRYVVELKQVVVFESSNRQAIAKDFLAYLAQPENLAAYTEGAQGRYLPVMPELFERPFWTDTSDPHISVAVAQLENTRPANQVLHPAYGEVAAQNIWGKVMRQIAVDGLSPQVAADQAIAEINEIFDAWN
ncbi:MAG: ABC transporter substrate-binding protein [Cyanobacteria bacterium P01_F01_bin.86]